MSTTAYSVDGDVAIIRLTRPPVNSLGYDLRASIAADLDRAQADDAVRAVVVTGSGGFFSAGADITEFGSEKATASPNLSELIARLEDSPKPVVAAIAGTAFGGGLELSLGAHRRVATASSQLGLPEVKLGLVPGFGGTQRLVRLAGQGAALALCLQGDSIDAARAHQLGIVSEVVADAELDARVDALATQLAAGPTEALRAVLDCVLEAGECPLDQGLAFETRAFALLFASDDMREGTQAFLERRKPEFR